MSKGECKVEYIDTQHQLADIFTKPLARERFYTLRNELGILDITCSHSLCLVNCCPIFSFIFCSAACVLPATFSLSKLLCYISNYMHTAYMISIIFFIPGSLWILHLLVCILCPDCVATCLTLALIHYRVLFESSLC